jgi:hypothetical protein
MAIRPIDMNKHDYAVLDRALLQQNTVGVIEESCPRCGKPIVYELTDSREIIRCEDDNCIFEILYGI